MNTDFSAPSVVTASVTVKAKNSTKAGAITFNTCDFLTDGTLFPNSLPPIIVPTLLDDVTDTILKVYSPPYYGKPNNCYCKGKVTFNLPTGPQLTITFNLNAQNGGTMPSIVAGVGYYVKGASTPKVDGYNYEFDIEIVAQ